MPVDAALEHEYVFSDRYPDRTEVYESIANSSERARREWPVNVDLAYGFHPRERLDLFRGPPASPLLIFIHGGYWSKLDKSSFSYLAPPFLRRGFSVAIVGYPLAPATALAEIVRSVRNGVQWLANEGTHHFPQSKSFYMCGHSAGAHLATMAAITDWGDESHTGQRTPPIKGCAALSGIFDLSPLVHTTIAGRIGLHQCAALALSPVRQPAPAGWLLAGVGGAETSAFVAQASGYVQRCRSLGASASMLVLPSANHYSVLLDLARDDGQFVRAVHSRAVRDASSTCNDLGLVDRS